MRAGVLTIGALFLSLGGRPAQGRSQYTSEDRAAGKGMYEAWCASCHGLDGRGNPPERTVPIRPMDLTDCGLTTSETDRDWETVIYHGGPAAGLSGDMASWGDSLGIEKVRQLVAYLRSFCPEEGWPPGELNFTLPLLTEKAFPENELVVEWKGVRSADPVEMEARLLLEKRFGKRGQVELALPVSSVSSVSGPRATGLGDLEAGLKYVLFYDGRRGSIFSAGLDIVFPSGSKSRGLGRGKLTYEPFLAFGQRIEELQAQAQLIYERPHDEAAGESELILLFSIGAPLTPNLASPWALLEISYAKELGPAGEGSVSLTPQLRFPLSRRDHLAVNGGVQLPVAGENTYRYRVLFYFLWEYREGGIWW